MAIVYLYRDKQYSTENEAQEALSAIKSRLDNNPTDWCEVKVIEANDDGSYNILPNKLTDAEILNPDSTKIYTFLSKYTGLNFFPLTSSEVTEKVNEYRRGYVASENLAVIKSYEDEGNEIVLPPTDGSIPDEPIEMPMTDITPNEDMSGYL